MNSIRIHPVAAGLVLVGLALLSAARGQQPQHAMRITPEQSEILSHMSIVYLDDGSGGQAKTIRFTGVNVQVVNGLGATNGNPALPYSQDALESSANSLGNIIVGYNEPNLSNPGLIHRTGSHNLVLGQRNNYESIGGAVLGTTNTLKGLYSSVLGGENNSAEALESVIVGGDANVTQQVGTYGNVACILGGSGNKTSGGASTVVGGLSNEAAGDFSAAVGGFHNVAQSTMSAIIGGADNTTGSQYAQSVCGGQGNTAVGAFSVIGGGQNRTAPGSYNWVAGSLLEFN